MLKIGQRGSGVWLCLAVVGLTVQSCGRSSADRNNGPTETPEAGSGGSSDIDYGTGANDSVGGIPQYNEGGGGFIEAGAPSYAGSPSAETCDPETRYCDGPSVRDCHDDIVEVCSLAQTCSEGACQGIVCGPGSTYCADGDIFECDENGASGKPFEACDSNEYCLVHDGKAQCSPTVCVPGEPLCLNQVATTCNDDGSGAVAGGKNCSSAGLLCSEGACVDPSCTAGQKHCEHDDVYLCLGSGAESVLFTDCAADEVCDPALAACRKRVCDPGKLSCDSTRVATCDSLGLGYEQSGTDCSSTNKLCVEGSCKAQVCKPSSTFCKDGDVYACDTLGVSSSLNQTCTPQYYHCAPHYYYVDQAYCAYNACTPGQTLCSGNVLTKCADDGSGPAAGGTDCGSDKICYNNSSCEPKACDPYSTFCQDGDIYYCQYNGLSSYLGQDCGSDARCVNKNNTLSCVPYDCSPGFKACLGNQVGVCSDDGTSLSSVKQDCTATSEVCTSTSACGSVAVDTLGNAEDLQSVNTDYFFGDIIDVESNRELTQIEVNVVLASTRTLRFVVYELTGAYFEAKYDQVVADQSGSGYMSSGSISYALKAGRRYLIGVVSSGGSAVPYYDAKPFQSDVSFGRAVGGFVSQYATSIYSYYYSTYDRVYDLRFTTQLP